MSLRSPSTKKKGARDAKAYLASLPADTRAGLQKLRKAVKAAAPKAKDGFSYGVPAFLLDGRPLVAYSAWKNHCSLYPMSGRVVRANAAELAKYETSRGTIRFDPKKPLPATLVRKIVKARIAELRMRGK